jgi:tetratricopeptide (TPR) repeat protein
VGRGDPHELALLWENQALFDFSTAHLEAALSALDRALDLASRAGELAKIVDVRALRALCFCFRGDWQRVDDEWGEAMAVARDVPGSLRLGQLLWARTRTDRWLGRPPPPTPSAESTYPGIAEFETAILATLGLVASERGDPRAEQWLSEAERRHPRDGVGLNWLPAAQALLVGWTNLGRASEAAGWSRALECYRDVLNLQFTAYELGRAAFLCGNLDLASRHLANAVRVARREGMRPYLGLALEQRALLGRARGRTGDRTRARRDADEAGELFHALGMRHPAGRKLG